MARIVLPESCRGCVYYRREKSLCHRHAPSPGDGGGSAAFQPVHWPEVSPEARCGSGADIREPGDASLVGCIDCIHWLQPGGVGLRPPYRGGRSAEWWEQTGYCTAHAPYPTTEARRGPVAWRVTHATDGCGDGQHLADAVEEDEDAMASGTI